jgi:hypothetical protein
MKNDETLHCPGTASATGTINDNDAAPTVATIAASATEGSPAVFEFSLSNPSAVDTTYTFTFTNGTAGSADYTTTNVTVTVYLRVLRNCKCTNNCDTIEKIMKTLLLPLERLRLLEQSMIMMRSTVATIAPASATEGSPACLNSA